MRVVTPDSRQIAYNQSFYNALESEGVAVVDGYFAGGWIYINLRKEDVFHIHWPSFLYEAQNSIPSIIYQFMRFIALIILVRYRTKHIWWTAHNLLPHTPCKIPFFDLLARYLVIRVAEKIFVHSEKSETILIDNFPSARLKCIQIPHGNWVERYLPLETKKNARTKLSLPQEAFVYLFFGQIKPYKNLAALINIFRESALDNAVLMVAGGFSDKQYYRDILKIAEGDPRIMFEPTYIPDNMVSTYLAASNAMCIPYREILTSGTAMLAMSYGLPLISIKRGFLEDVVSKSTGLLIEPNNDSELKEAMQNVIHIDWSAKDILEHAKKFTFYDAARIFISELPVSSA